MLLQSVKMSLSCAIIRCWILHCGNFSPDEIEKLCKVFETRQLMTVEKLTFLVCLSNYQLMPWWISYQNSMLLIQFWIPRCIAWNFHYTRSFLLCDVYKRKHIQHAINQFFLFIFLFLFLSFHSAWKIFLHFRRKSFAIPMMALVNYS